ncbi:hypothetical protein D3C72_1658540 [compost metagenome]
MVYNVVAVGEVSAAAFANSAAPAWAAPLMSGRICATPLWQSIQVSPCLMATGCWIRASGRWAVMSIASKLWQERQVAESFSLSVFQTDCAMASLCASYFSGVSMVPTISP